MMTDERAGEVRRYGCVLFESAFRLLPQKALESAAEIGKDGRGGMDWLLAHYPGVVEDIGRELAIGFQQAAQDRLGKSVTTETSPED